MELLAPAGSPEGLRAAVMNGADAVYFALKDFGARRSAKNFTAAEAREAVEFCHLRGVKAYVTMNTLVFDRELDDFYTQARELNSAGVDAVLVQDLGALKMLHECFPDMELHASTQMSVTNAEGAKLAASLGCTRAVAARELSRDELRRLTAESPIETEVFIHGAYCFCYSGQCYFSAVIGGRSGNRGCCAQPCRLAYGFGDRADEYPLSLKDMSLAGHLAELREMGVKSLKIEGRLKRPEYAAITTRIYANALKDGREPTREELETLAAVFSRDGFTDGYFIGKKNSPAMLGRRSEEKKSNDRIFAEARRSYAEGAREPQRVGVKFAMLVRENSPSLLAVEDEDGHGLYIEGARAERARSRALSPAEVTTQLYKTGGTPYRCDFARAKIAPGLTMPLSEINAMRRTVLEKLSEKRLEIPARRVFEQPRVPMRRRETAFPAVSVDAHSILQVSDRMLADPPEWIYMPLEMLVREPERTKEFLSAAKVAAKLPRVAHPSETDEISDMLGRVSELGVRTVLAGNIGYIDFARSRGFEVRGDYGLNITNSLSLETLAALGLSSAAVSFELTAAQIRGLSSPLPLEMIAYGRLPLMITERRLGVNGSSAKTLVDRTGARFPFERVEGGRSEIFNSQKLWLADRLGELAPLGLETIRLMFTTENPREAENVLSAYRGSGTAPAQFTRGLYFRGVE